MIKKLYYTIFFLFLFLLPASFSFEMSDSFGYADAFVNHGWDYNNGACGFDLSTPASNTFGIYGINPCGFGYTRYIRQNFSYSGTGKALSSTSVLISMVFYDGNDSVISATRGEIQLAETKVISPSFSISFSYLPSTSGLDNTTTLLSYMGGQNCSFKYMRFAQHELSVYLDFQAERYYALMDGVNYCWGYKLGNSITNYIGAIKLLEARDTSDRNTFYIDNIVYNTSGSLLEFAVSQPSHDLFIDDFNYVNPMYIQKGWLVYTGSYAINTGFEPVNNRLDLTSSDFASPSHTTGSFVTAYYTGFQQYLTSSVYSPVFSSQFDVNITSVSSGIDSCLQYAGYSGAKDKVYNIALCPNRSVLYQNDLYDSSSYATLCDNCILNDTIFTFKATTYFKNRPAYPFNSSVFLDHIDVFNNEIKIGEIDQFINPSASNLQEYYIIKNINTKAIIDNYKVYLGSDVTLNNANLFYTDIYKNNTELIIGNPDNAGHPSGDVATDIFNVYSMIGLKSQASRVLVGLFLLFILIIFSVFIQIYFNQPANPIVIGIVAIIGIIGFTYLQLFPVWIPILIAIVAIGGVVFAFLMKSGG